METVFPRCTEEACVLLRNLFYWSWLNAVIYIGVAVVMLRGFVRSMYPWIEDLDRIRQGGIIEVAFRYLRKAGALGFEDKHTRQRDQENWIKDIECSVERCPKCRGPFGPSDRCRICRTPRRRNGVNVS
jgi:hypothetical protein